MKTIGGAAQRLSSNGVLPAALCLLFTLTGCGGGGTGGGTKGAPGALGGIGGKLPGGAPGNGGGNPGNGGGAGACGPVNGKKPNGAACTANADCAGNVCVGLDFANKQNKTGICSQECTKTADCGASGACVQSGNVQLCAVACKASADCCDGFVCVNASAGLAICYVEATGGGGNQASACGLVNGKKPTGGDCTADSDCAGNVCLNLNFNNKQNKAHMCSQGCNADADCGQGAACVQTDNVKFCAPRCNTTADCCDGFACMDAGGFGVCFVENS